MRDRLVHSPNRRSTLRLLVAGTCLIPSAAGAQKRGSDWQGDGAHLFDELGQLNAPVPVTRIFTAGRTIAGKFAAAYRLDESQVPMSAGGTALYQAAIASGQGAQAAEAAILALERRIRVQMADGRWFTLDEHRPLAGHFGAIGDGRADDTDALQAMIDWHVYWGEMPSKAEIHFGAGRFRTSRALHAPYGGAETLHHVQLIGEGMSYDSGFAGTTILCGHDTGMGVNFQGARNGGARDLSIRGRLSEHITKMRLGAEIPAIDDLRAENWSDPRLPGTADRRFSPFAGITVDAYSGPRPDRAYPAVAYPAWLPGGTVQYGRAQSSGLRFQRIGISGFNAGFVNQPSDFDANGDFTALDGCAIQHCVYAISIGNSQSRNFSLDDSQAAYCHTFLTTRRHGRQNGRVQGTWKDFHVSNGIRLFEIHTTSVAGPLHFDTVYAEALYEIGEIGGGTSAETAIIFNGGSLSFQLQASALRGVPLFMLGSSGTPAAGPRGMSVSIQFNGTSFTNFPTVLTLLTDGVVLRGCLVQSTLSSSGTSDRWRRFAFNTLAGGLVTAGLETRGRKHEISYSAFDLGGGNARASITTREGSEASDRAHCLSHYAPSARARSIHSMEILVNPQPVLAMDKAALPDMALVGRRLTFLAPMSGQEAERLGLVPGGIIYDAASGLLFWVATIIGAPGRYKVTAELQNGWRGEVSAGVANAEFDPRSGRFFFVTGRYYTPASPLFFDGSRGGMVLTRVSSAAGEIRAEQEEIRTGDVVVAEADSDQWLESEDAAVTSNHPGAIGVSVRLRGDVARKRLKWLRRSLE
jgi:hypothetical protein